MMTRPESGFFNILCFCLLIVAVGGPACGGGGNQPDANDTTQQDIVGDVPVDARADGNQADVQADYVEPDQRGQTDVVIDVPYAADDSNPVDSAAGDTADTEVDVAMTPENNEATCSDGFSNDGDSYTDCDDYDCDCAKACGGTGCAADCVQGPENTEAACSDGCSNDGDSYIDCDDYDCVTTDYCSASQD